MRKLLLIVLLAFPAFAQPIKVLVDATDAPRRLFHARMTIPATPGPMRLAFARWIPGEHGPTGPIENLVNIRVSANDERVEWRRDPVEMTQFHVDVPRGATSLVVETTHLSPTAGGSFTAGLSATPNLAVMSWNTLLLYPLRSGDDVMVEGSIRLPEGWSYATALLPSKESASRVDFKPETLTTYIDSPVLMGRFLRHIPLSAPNAPAHRIDIASEAAASLKTWPTFTDDYARLITQAGALFGAYHFRKYDWLVALSDNVTHFGLEHHESSDNRMPERTLADPGLRRSLASLLAHEYVHSWNGKHRRPAVMLSADYQTPVHGELLWVYEGLTNYLGYVLATRAGLWTEADWRERVAAIAASLDAAPGRAWRPLGDTAVGAQTVFGSPHAWSSQRRGVDFYPESVLLWLEVDALLRQHSNGRASLDDFCRAFFGGRGGMPTVRPYTFDEIVNTLTTLAPFDWRKHLNERLWATDTRAPLAGFTMHGWRLAYDETPNQGLLDEQSRHERTDYTFSLGFSLTKDGVVRDVLLDSPAGKSGIGPGMKIIAVNDRKWTREMLETAVREAKGTTEPIRLLVESGEFYRTHAIDYHGGLRYPHLVRDPSRPDTLADVLRGRR